MDSKLSITMGHSKLHSFNQSHKIFQILCGHYRKDSPLYKIPIELIRYICTFLINYKRIDSYPVQLKLFEKEGVCLKRDDVGVCNAHYILGKYKHYIFYAVIQGEIPDCSDVFCCICSFNLKNKKMCYLMDIYSSWVIGSTILSGNKIFIINRPGEYSWNLPTAKYKLQIIEFNLEDDVFTIISKNTMKVFQYGRYERFLSFYKSKFSIFFFNRCKTTKMFDIYKITDGNIKNIRPKSEEEYFNFTDDIIKNSTRIYPTYFIGHENKQLFAEYLPYLITIFGHQKFNPYNVSLWRLKYNILLLNYNDKAAIYDIGLKKTKFLASGLIVDILVNKKHLWISAFDGCNYTLDKYSYF